MHNMYSGVTPQTNIQLSTMEESRLNSLVMMSVHRKTIIHHGDDFNNKVFEKSGKKTRKLCYVIRILFSKQIISWQLYITIQPFQWNKHVWPKHKENLSNAISVLDWKSFHFIDVYYDNMHTCFLPTSHELSLWRN